MKENMIIYAILAILAGLFLYPYSGLMAVEEPFGPCPYGVDDIPSPCESAFWEDTPKCAWNISQCSGFCVNDANCTILVDAPNDCTLFFKSHTIPKYGYCEYSFCKYSSSQVPVPECSAAILFFQKWKWVIIALFAALIIFAIFEKDWKGKKRGFI